MDENAFTLMPMSQTMSLKAGNTYDGYVTIANPMEATSNFDYVANVAPYSVVGEEYLADLATRSDANMLADWITIENPTGTIEPNGTVKVHYTIKVPKDAPAGGQYAAITVYSNPGSREDGGVAINNIIEMASVIYGQVQGEIVHDGEVLSNNIPGFITSLPLVTDITFVNKSNVHEVATIKIEVKNALTGETVFPKDDESNLFSELTMPNTTRLLTREISQLSDLGVYQVSQSVTYLGENYDNTQTVFVCPLWFMGLVALTIVAFVLTIVKMVKRHRHHKI
ncbi:hypothetical protein IJG04_02815 [Candidatus Saccharibacteria bacterium]|nr:hypothetical protein [Candidatus Saccharibacteria bacterium]